MSIEDRVRAATRARTDLVRSVRPLEFPAQAPAPARRDRSRRWLNWGAPIAAAALVTALALTLALLRQADGPQPGQVTPAASQTALTSIPRYYVALADAFSANSQLKAVVGDDQTGRTVAVLNPSASQNFYGVTAAADDRTFVVMNYTAATQETTWYLLRIAPGTARPTQLTKLPIKPVVAHVAGLALSPDGRELAVMWRTATTQTNAVTYLAVYSMASGAALHTWITKGDNVNAIAGGGNGEGLAWVNGDRSVDFLWTVITRPPHRSSTQTIRRVDVSAPGGDLLADSRVAVRFPPTATATKSIFSEPCGTSVIANDGTIACGTVSFSDVSFQEVCSTVPPSFVTYSAVSGKRLKVLYQWHGQCLEAQAMPAWTDAGGRHVIAFLLLSEKGVKISLTDEWGLVANGRFTALPKLVTGITNNVLNQGGLAF